MCPLSAKCIVLFVIFFILNRKERHKNMIEKMVLNVVNLMETKKIIEKSNSEYYEYALVSLAERIIAVGTMLAIGILFEQFIPTIIFLVFFLSLRKRTGGYHADKFWQCYLVTIITYIGVIKVAVALSEKSSVAMYAILVLAVLIIEVIGTVNHPNIDLDKGELRETKRAARLLVLMEAAIIAMLVALGINQLYVSYMSIAIILCSSLMCLAKILKQEVKVK
jgi:accessory gene regulator B